MPKRKSEKMLSEIKKHLESVRIMQLATAVDNQPWACSVYFVSDNKLNLYWLSLPTRRHSKELSQNNNAAVSFHIKDTLPVIGLQAEGAVEVANNLEVVEKIMQIYVEKYGSGKEFSANVKKGTNQHKLYRLIPRKFVLFDEVNYPENPRREMQLNEQ